MITTRVIPVSTATEQQFLVEITEKLCRSYCYNDGNRPATSVTFTAGAVRVVNGIASTTITAVVTVLTPCSCDCGCAKPQVFTESFDVAFVATATNAITLTPGDDTVTAPAYVKCCKAAGIRLSTTLTVTIA